METYVVNVGGNAVLAFRAEDDEQARAVAHSSNMQSDLRTLTDMDGKPLWDGTSDIQVLRASADHHAEWEQSRDQAVTNGDIDLNAGDSPDDWEVYFLEIPGTNKGRPGRGGRA
jgi:hypothetical protein